MSARVTFELPTEGLVVQAAPPELVSQANCEAALGLPRAAFLELLREPGAPTTIRVGKLRLVDRVAFVAWLKARASSVERPPSAAGVLHEMGLVPYKRAG